MRVLVALVVASCGGKNEAPPPDPPLPSGSSSVANPQRSVTAPDPALPVTPPEFPEGTRSLELLRTVGVRIEPGDGAKRIGTVAIDTRVGWTRTQKAKGCKDPWVEIRPRGWICGDYVKASKKAPFGREVPFLERGELVPGVYGKITAPNSVTYVMEKPKKPEPKRKRPGPVTSTKEVPVEKPKLIEGKPIVGSVNVRQYDELVVEGKTYWKISQKDPEYVLGQAISKHRPSFYGGARLGDDTGWGVPLAFVWPRVYGWQQASTSYKPAGGGQVRMLAARTPLPILDTFADKTGKPIAYRVGTEEWIAAADVRIFNPAPPPAQLFPNERWIDIDLESQVLVAFEGTVAVYSTMVSTGGKETPTLPGIYRMWLKESEADMKGLNGEDPYSVATVPWTQFFSSENDLALHSAYWHDQFGVKRSHGCVNLAPRDARWLYFWSDPQVPPGWTMAAGVVEAPGSIVRVRTKDEPNPPLREYAVKVNEARLQNAPVR